MSRLSSGTLLLGIIAVLFGLFGAYAVRQYLREAPPEVAEVPAPEKVTVPVASMPLVAGREIKMGDIAILKLTKQQMKERGITKAFMSRPDQIMGRVLREDVPQGATFAMTMFYPEGTGPSLAERLQPGMRAATVTVEMNAAVAGFAVPGTWVDVLFRSEPSARNDVPETTVTLLEGVQVLAVAQEMFEGARPQSARGQTSRSTTVTLAVTPEQAARLQVVEGRGSLSLVLRNPEDDQHDADLAAHTLDDVLQLPPVKTHQIEVYRGRQVSRVEFADDGRVPSDMEQFTAAVAPAAPAPPSLRTKMTRLTSAAIGQEDCPTCNKP